MVIFNIMIVIFRQVVKMIDYLLLYLIMINFDILEGFWIFKRYGVVMVCVKLYLVFLVIKEFEGSDVLVCFVIGFFYGNSIIQVKVFEVEVVVVFGGKEIDMVINIGMVLSGEWDYVVDEICQINEVVIKYGVIFKVIFENDYFEDYYIIEFCQICFDIGVVFIKMLMGYGFVK